MNAELYRWSIVENERLKFGFWILKIGKRKIALAPTLVGLSVLCCGSLKRTDSSFREKRNSE